MWSSIKNFFASIGSWFSRQDLAGDVAKVQSATVEACGFLPTAATVANLVAAGNPTVMTATGLAAAICSVVTKPAMPIESFVEPVPMINGIPIMGSFVKKGN